MTKESDFIEGLEYYKQKTDLFPHDPATIELRKKKLPIAGPRKIAKATKHSILFLRESEEQNIRT